MAKKYLYKGKEYLFRELAKLAECAPRVLQQRLSKNWTVERAVETPQRKVFRRSFRLEVDGEKLTVAKAAKKLGVSPGVIWKGVDQGKSVKEIMENPLIGKKPYEAKEGLCTRHEINQMAKDSSLSYNTIGKRLFDGWSIEEALNTPVLPGVRREMRFRVMYKGKDYTMKELSQLPECVVSADLLTSRIKKKGWDVEKAVTTKPLSGAERAEIARERGLLLGRTAKKYMYKGKEYTLKELLALPECEVQQYNTLCDRINKKGLSIEEALKVRRGERYRYHGKLLTVSELTELPECKVNINTLRYRLQSGMTAEKAITLSRKVKTYEYKGQHYSVKELAKLPECKVREHVLYERLKTECAEKAITTPVRSAAECAKIASEAAHKNGICGRKAGKYMYKGKLCTIKELIALPECKLSYTGLFARLKNGWDVERAVTAGKNEEKDLLQNKVPSKARKYELSGKYYSLSELLKLPECKVSEPTLSLNLRNGIAVKDAIVFKRKRGRKKKTA